MGALADTIEFANAVQAAYEATDPEETLILVTADHGHVFTIAGYPKRANPILGKVVPVGSTDAVEASDGMPYTTLGYMNGLGYAWWPCLSSPDSKHSTIRPACRTPTLRPESQARRALNGGQIEIEWMPTRKLMSRYEYKDDKGAIKWELKSRIDDGNGAKSAVTRRLSYQDTDYADIGDNESDPFFQRMINLGFIEHEASGFYAAEGHIVSGGHDHHGH